MSFLFSFVFHLCTISLCLALFQGNLSAQNATGKTYRDGHGGRVFLPLGDISFADEVISFIPGKPAAIRTASNPASATGIPDFDQYSVGFVSLGCGGTLVLRFSDNVLVDIPGGDLYVFELGKYVEKTSLFISKNGKNWIEIGTISGGRTEIDISPFCKPLETFNYVKLVDLKDSCNGRWPGADIDAVAAIGSGKSIPISNSVLFNFDTSLLLAKAYPTLDSIAKIISGFKNGVQVIIEGHTDSVGVDTYNKRLSENRSNAVKKYLLSKCKTTVFKTFGYGNLYPSGSNQTEEGRKKNRRVEIILLPLPTPKNKV